jgi:hypothetical protein
VKIRGHLNFFFIAISIPADFPKHLTISDRLMERHQRERTCMEMRKSQKWLPHAPAAVSTPVPLEPGTPIS